MCVYREVRSQTTEWVRDGVAAYDVSDYGDEAFGVGDCGVARVEDEGYNDYGRGVGRGECEKWESRSD